MENEDFIEIDPADMEEEIVDTDLGLEAFNEDLPKETAEEKPVQPDISREFVEELASQNGYGQDVDGFVAAFRESQEQQEERDFIQQVMYEYNISEEEAVETLNQFREQERQETQKQEQARQQEEEAVGFLKEFKKINGREWEPGSDNIPDEVWQIQLKSKIPLKQAYKEYKQDESFLKGFNSY